MPANYEQIPPERKDAYLQNAEAAVNEAASDLLSGLDTEALGQLDPRAIDLGKAALSPEWFKEEAGAREAVAGTEWLLKEDDANTDAAAKTAKDAEDFANTYDTTDMDIMEMTKQEQLRGDLTAMSKKMDSNYYRALNEKLSYGVNWGEAGPPPPPIPEETAKRSTDDAALMQRLILERKWRKESPAPIEPSAPERPDGSI